MPSALNFPSNPTVGQQYAVGPRTFSWDGTTWRVYSSSEEDPVLTQEEIQDFVAPLLNHASHSNITASYNDADNKIILSGTATLTNEQVQDAIAPLFDHTNHTNVTATYDDDNNKILLSGAATLTTEQVQDAIAPLFDHASHTNLTASYDDDNNKILLTGTATIGDEQIQDAIAPLFNHSEHSNITASYDDENNKIILTAEEAGSTVTVSATAPESPIEGNIWYNSSIAKLFIYYGNLWVEV